MKKTFTVVIACSTIVVNALKADEVSKTLNSMRIKSSIETNSAESGNIVAKVNGSNITQEHLDELFNASLKASGSKRSDMNEEEKLAGYNQLLQDLIMDRLVALASENEIVTDSDVEAELAKIKKEFPDDKTFQAQLGQAEMPLEKLKENIRTGLKQTRWISSKITLPSVSEQQAKAYYDSNISEFKQPGGDLVPFAEVKEQVITYLQGVNRQEAVQDLLAKLKSSANIEIFLRKDLKTAAIQGDAMAQYELGSKLMDGKGVKDEAQGAEWLRKSAEQGNSNAQALLSLCYQMGKGVEQNQAEADRWKRKANEGMQAEMDDQMKKYLAITKDEKSILDGGPSTETVVRQLMGVYSVFESYYRDSSFTIERGKTLISKGYANIPIGCEMYPIKLSGTTSAIYYFYKDEFDAWKSVKKE